MRRFLQPGPIVLISSAWKNETNIMTLGWQTVMEFEPSLVGCMITAANHSFELIRRMCHKFTTADLIDKVVRIGNTSGADIDKFKHFP